MYRVKVVSQEGLEFWLGYGQLKRFEYNGTSYSSPSAANAAAQKYMDRSRNDRLTYWLIGPNGGQIIEKQSGKTGMHLVLVALPDGNFRASGRGVTVTGRSAKRACYDVVKQWLGEAA